MRPSEVETKQTKNERNNEMNNNNDESKDEKYWLGVRKAALELFGAVPEEFREAPPQAIRWLRLRDAAVMAWSALPPEFQATASEEAR